jgi:hypothetical protein
MERHATPLDAGRTLTIQPWLGIRRLNVLSGLLVPQLRRTTGNRWERGVAWPEKDTRL